MSDEVLAALRIELEAYHEAEDAPITVAGLRALIARLDQAERVSYVNEPAKLLVMVPRTKGSPPK